MKVKSGNLAVNIEKLKAALQLTIESAMHELLFELQEKAKENCPPTWDLRDTIMHLVDVKSNKIIGRVGTNQKHAPYVHEGTGIYASKGNGRQTPWAVYVEIPYLDKEGKEQHFFTTRGIKPTPFLREAFYEMRPNILKYMAKEIKRCWSEL
jgi:hypothetical protein